MKATKIEAQKVLGTETDATSTSYTDKDSIIYALSIGFSKDPLRSEDYKFTSEFEDNFTTFPTYVTCLAKLDFFSPLTNSPHMPEFSPFMVLHAEQRIEFFKPLKIGAVYNSKGRVTNVADKGKMALITYTSTTQTKGADGKDEIAITAESSLIIKGLGGFGFKGTNSSSKIPDRPTRQPDFKFNDESYPGQAFLYRLNFDTNPLHIKPDIAALQQFPQPILHGLATYGIVARSFVQNVLKNDETLLKVYHARFMGHVFPGEKYQIEVWKQPDHYWFRVVVVERNKECLVGHFTVREGAKL